MIRLKRGLALAAGIASGLLFGFFIMLAGWMILFGEKGAWIGLIITAFDLPVIWVANNIHDGLAWNAKNYRWCANTLFFTMVVLVMEVLVFMADIREFSEQTTMLYCMVYTTAIVYAVHMYRKTYGRMFPGRERLNILSVKNVRYRYRRLYMLVEESHLQNGLCYCKGHVLGNIHILDRLYIYQNGQPVISSRVVHIFKEGNSLKDVKGGFDITVVLSLRKPIRAYSVLSDVREGYVDAPEVFAENPRVVGLASFFSKCCKDGRYLETLSDALANGHYIVPCNVRLKDRGNLAQTLPSGLQVSLPAVTRNDSPGERILPVFTDWSAVREWAGFVDGADSAVMPVDFEKLLSLHKEAFDGIAINPFNHASFYMTKDLVDLLLTLQSKNR